MPFTFDSGTQLFVAAHGRAVRALRFDRLSKSAIVVQNYVGHNEEVNDIVVAAHLLLSCSDEVLCHDFGTGRLKWRLLRPFGCRIAKLAVLGDVLVCCMEDCSVAFISIRRGAVSYYTELNGERKGGVPFIGIDPVNRMAYVNGNRCVNGWSLAVGRRVFNTDLVVGQVCNKYY